MLLVLLSVGVLGAPPAPEGWWPPKTVALSDMGLDEAAVSRLAAATVSLGIGRSGTLISRDGLVLSSATAVAGAAETRTGRHPLLAAPRPLGPRFGREGLPSQVRDSRATGCTSAATIHSVFCALFCTGRWQGAVQQQA